MKLTVVIRNVYGNQTVYPCCDTSKKLLELTGTKTFTSRHIQTLEDLGYTLEVHPVTIYKERG